MRIKFQSPKKGVADAIRAAFNNVSPMSIRPRAPLAIRDMIATLTARGLGDCVMLTDLPFIATQHNRLVNIWAGTNTFVEVMKFHPSYRYTSIDCGVVNPFLVDLLRLREVYDLGNGHQLQQFRRAWGFPVEDKPKGALVNNETRHLSRVILHFEPSKTNVVWQREHWHPKMRELYPESKSALEAFIAKHSDLEFIQVGKTNLEIHGAGFVPTPSTVELIKLIQSGSWFIGIMSGPLHIAVASGLKCIVMVNFPEARRIVLPTLRYTGTPEEEWYYPQNVHLHQEGESPLVPKFTRYSLEAAFSGDVYPFWQDDWLEMIHETSKM
jgi:hypothetical protein